MDTKSILVRVGATAAIVLCLAGAVLVVFKVDGRILRPEEAARPTETVQTMETVQSTETVAPKGAAAPTETAPGASATPVPRGVVAAATQSAGSATPRTTALSGDVALGEGGIWVTGTGQLTMEPDLVILNLGVETFEATVLDANGGAARAMDAVMGSLRSNGVEDRDMQTHNYNVQPQYEWVEVSEKGRVVSKQQLIGYRVVNNLKVKVRDLDAVGSLIDQVVTAGGDATRFNGLRFTVEDTSTRMTDLRQDGCPRCDGEGAGDCRHGGCGSGCSGVHNRPANPYLLHMGRADQDRLASIEQRCGVHADQWRGARGLPDRLCGICNSVAGARAAWDPSVGFSGAAGPTVSAAPLLGGPAARMESRS